MFDGVQLQLFFFIYFHFAGWNSTQMMSTLFLIFVSSGAGKVVNIRRLDEVINSINGWYMERGLFGLVCCHACT